MPPDTDTWNDGMRRFKASVRGRGAMHSVVNSGVKLELRLGTHASGQQVQAVVLVIVKG